VEEKLDDMVKSSLFNKTRREKKSLTPYGFKTDNPADPNDPTRCILLTPFVFAFG